MSQGIKDRYNYKQDIEKFLLFKLMPIWARRTKGWCKPMATGVVQVSVKNILQPLKNLCERQGFQRKPQLHSRSQEQILHLILAKRPRRYDQKVTTAVQVLVSIGPRYGSTFFISVHNIYRQESTDKQDDYSYLNPMSPTSQEGDRAPSPQIEKSKQRPSSSAMKIEKIQKSRCISTKDRASLRNGRQKIDSMDVKLSFQFSRCLLGTRYDGASSSTDNQSMRRIAYIISLIFRSRQAQPFKTFLRNINKPLETNPQDLKDKGGIIMLQYSI